MFMPKHRLCAMRIALVLLLCITPQTQATSNITTTSVEQSNFHQHQVVNKHLDFLNEFSARRRVNTLFENPQEPEAGIAINYINSFKGNLTFIRRDLVVVARIPIVFSRYYDSARVSDPSDFAPGWFLNYSRSLQRIDNSIYRYVDEQGKVYQLQVNQQNIQTDSLQANQPILQSLTDTHIQLFTGNYRLIFELNADYALPVREEDAYGNGLTFEYDNGRLSRILADNGRAVSIQRDTLQRIVGISDTNSRQVAYQYNSDGQLTSVQDLAGQTWQYRYSSGGRLSQILNPNGHVSLSVEYYSDGGNIGKVSNSQVGAKKHSYSYQNSQTTVLLADSERLYIQHTDTGLATILRRQNGLASELRFDPQGQVAELRNSASGHYQYIYDQQGKLSSIVHFTVKGEKTSTYHYNARHQLQKISGNNLSLQLEYDGHGRVVYQNANGEISQFDYNLQGDLIRKEKGGQVTAYLYNADGQVIQVESDNGLSKLEYYDDGRLHKVVFPDGATHSYQYNLRGQRTATFRSNGQHLVYEYDAVGNMLEQLEYEANGKSKHSNILVDEFNRTLGMTIDGKPAFSIRYNNLGQISSVSQAQVTTDYGYDSLGRLVEINSGNNQFLYNYGDNEKDILQSMDDRTPIIATYGLSKSLNAVFFNRVKSTAFFHLLFDQDSLSYRLASPWAVVQPQNETHVSQQRRRFYNLTQKSSEQVNFDKPSSSFFLPAEYNSINCYPYPCTADAYIRVSGTVESGTDFYLHGSIGYGFDCRSTAAYSWIIDGVLQSSRPETLQLNFPLPGTRNIILHASCLCAGGMQSGEYQKNICVEIGPAGVLYENLVSHCPGRSQNSRLHEIDGCTAPLPLGQNPAQSPYAQADSRFGKPQGGNIEKQQVLNYPCNRHDLCYQSCKNSKASCDASFKSRMDSVCSRAFPEQCPLSVGPKSQCSQYETARRECATWSNNYYQAVNEWGQGPFELRQSEHCNCCGG